MNNTQLNYRFKNVCFKNISFGIAALIAAIGYSVERIDHCYREHVAQMRSGFFFAVNVERQLKAEAKEKYDAEHPEEVEARKKEAEEKRQKQIDDHNERLVKQVLDERNRRLQKIAEKSSTEVK